MASKEHETNRGGARLERHTPPKKRKPRRPLSRRERVIRIAMVAVAALAALALIVIAAVLLWVREPEVPVQPDRSNPPAEESLEPGESPAPTASSDRKDDFWTFLVVGRDTYGGGNTDTMLLAAYDIANQDLNVMSIPRDTMVNVSWDIKRINSVYNAYGGGAEGMAALKEEIGELVGFQPDFTVTVEWEAVGELVEAIGGVWFDVPRDMYYNDLSQNFKIDLKAGYQLLDGDQAMQLLRYRHDSDDNGNILNSGYANGDLGRIEVQQDFLKATIEQCLENIDVGNIASLAGVFLNNVTAEGLSLGNLIWFAQQAMVDNGDGEKLSIENVNFVTMPCTGQYVLSRTSGRQSYVLPNVDELVELVNECFNPYVDDLREDELDIMYVNADGTLGATGGTLEDTRYNAWIQERNAAAAATPTPTATPEPALTPTPAPSPTATPEPSPSEEPSASPSGGGETQPQATPPAQTQEPSPPPATAEPTPETSGEPAAGQGEGGTVSVLPAMPTPVQP